MHQGLANLRSPRGLPQLSIQRERRRNKGDEVINLNARFLRGTIIAKDCLGPSEYEMFHVEQMVLRDQMFHVEQSSRGPGGGCLSQFSENVPRGTFVLRTEMPEMFHVEQFGFYRETGRDCSTWNNPFSR